MQPYLSNNISGYKDIQVDISGRQSCGGLGCAYFNIESKNRNKINNKINNIIFKTITDKKEEFKSLIFHYLIYKYYENNNIDNLKYLCKLYEFGELKNCNLTINGEIIKYYAIMENCGMNLSEYFEIIIERNKKISVKDRLKELITIFKECCNAVKIMHDLGYLHLDIKPKNFLISNEGQIKIIDFGFIKKNGYKTKKLFGTGIYMANDWVKNFFSGKETTLEYHHDIFSLGCMFIELLYRYVFIEKIEMACPIINQISQYDNILAIRMKYDSSLQNNKIKTKLQEKNNISLILENNILNLIINMVNSHPFLRYKNIDLVMEKINIIQKNSSNL